MKRTMMNHHLVVISIFGESKKKVGQRMKKVKIKRRAALKLIRASNKRKRKRLRNKINKNSKNYLRKLIR